MVSARSRYQHHRPVIRRAISSLFGSCPASRLIALPAALRCVALLLAVPTRTCQPSSAALPSRKSTTTYRPACHHPPAVAHGTYLPRLSGAAAHRAHLAPAADSSLSSARAMHHRLVRALSAPSSLSLVVCICACLRRAVSASLPVSLCVFAAPTHPDESIPSIHITIHPRPRPTIRHTRTILDASMRLSHRRP